MSIFKRFDAWVGKRLFIPPIIRWCQFAKCTQYAVGNTLLFVFWLCALYDIDLSRWYDWFFGALFIVMAILTMIVASLYPNLETKRDAPVIRLVIMVMLVSEAFYPHAVHILKWMCLLTASYAFTIKTIPPLETRQKSAKLKEKIA